MPYVNACTCTFVRGMCGFVQHCDKLQFCTEEHIHWLALSVVVVLLDTAFSALIVATCLAVCLPGTHRRPCGSQSL